MTWVRIDDGFPGHPKVLAAGGDAAWLYVCALAYCNHYLTDGFVPTSMLARLSDRKRPHLLAAKLVEVGMWETTEDGWVVHDYLEFQASKETVEAERVKARERMANARRSSPNVRPNNTRTTPERSEELRITPDQTRPDHPILVKTTDDLTSVALNGQSSSVEKIIELTAKALARADRPDPSRRYIDGIARNVRIERQPEIDRCIEDGLTIHEAAVRLTGSPAYVELAELELPA